MVGVSAATTTNTGQWLPLPQDYADMLGLEQQVAAVARVYASLPPADCASGRDHVVTAELPATGVVAGGIS